MSPGAQSLLAALWLCGACPVESIDPMLGAELVRLDMARIVGNDFAPTARGKHAAVVGGLRMEVAS